MPRWQWNLASGLPVGWFGSNTSGYENSAQLDSISRYDLAIFGWQAFLQATNYTREAEHLVYQARAVKAINPSTKVWVYRNYVKALAWMDSVQEKLNDPAYAGWFVQNRSRRDAMYPS